MGSIQKRENSNGTISYKVRIRYKNEKLITQTFFNYEHAVEFCNKHQRLKELKKLEAVNRQIDFLDEQAKSEKVKFMGMHIEILLNQIKQLQDIIDGYNLHK